MENTFFKQLGLTENEKNIYLLLLQSGQSPASIIGKRMNLKRLTAYAALESLDRKGLATTIHKNNIKFYEAAPPETLMTLCDKRIEKETQLKNSISKSLDKLKELRSRFQKPTMEIQGKLKYYKGTDAVKELIDETLNEKETLIYCYGINTYHTSDFAGIWRKYTKKRVNQNICVRSIQPDTKVNRDYKDRDSQELRKTYLIPHKKFKANSEINIIGDMIAMFTFEGDEPLGMKCYNKPLAETFKSLFDLAWERAKEYASKEKND